MGLLLDISAFFLFALEFYHILAHSMIMCGLRTLPRRDLVRIRFYFLVDGLTVVCSSLLLTQRMQWLMAIHLAQHLYYFLAWNKTYFAKKIIDWSSLEYCKRSHPVELDSTLGTLFDIVVHGAMMYSIYPMLDTFRIIAALLVAQAALYAVLFNPRFAWSNPRNMPKWVEKRLGKLGLEEWREQEENESKNKSN